MPLTGEDEREWLGLQSPGTSSKGIKGTDVASAATIALSAYLTVVSGVAAISLITLPFDGFSGTLALRPTGIFTLATGGVATTLNKPIGLAATAVVGRILMITYDSASALWYPHY